MKKPPCSCSDYLSLCVKLSFAVLSFVISDECSQTALSRKSLRTRILLLLGATRQHISKIEADLRSAENDRKLTTEQYKQTKDQLTRVSEELSEMQRKARTTGSDNDKLASDIYKIRQEKESEIEKLKSSIRLLEREIDTLKREADQSKDQYENEHREKVSVQQELNVISKQLINLELAYISAKDQKDQKHWEGKSDLERTVSDLKDMVDHTERELQQRSQQYSTLETRYHTLL